MKIKNISIILSLLFVLISCKEQKMGRDGLFMTGTSLSDIVKFPIDNATSFDVSVSATKNVEANVDIYLEVSKNAVAQYNSKHGTQYELPPEASFKLEGESVVIPAGQSVSSAVKLSIVDREKLADGASYLIPVSIKSVGTDMDVIESNRTIYLKLSRTVLFAAPYIGTIATSRSFDLPEEDIVKGVTKYTWEVKFRAENFKINTEGEPLKVCGVNNNMLRFGESGNPGNVLEVYAGSENKMIANTQFATNTWYMLSIVNDGKNLTLYVNGVKDNSMSVTPYDYQFDGVTIGQSLPGYERKQLFRGWLGGMRYWNRALSAREIRSNLCGVSSAADGLVANYQMNEGEGNILYDSSPNGFNLVYPDNVNLSWTAPNNECIE